jgi:uncharacterized protein (DUF433 family)
MTTAERYVQQREGNWYVADSRVELYSVIAAWQQGYAPEEIQDSFPVLTQAEVYGVILFYIEHRDEMDAFFREVDVRYVEQKAAAETADPAFYAMMRERMAAFQAARAAGHQERGTAAS